MRQSNWGLPIATAVGGLLVGILAPGLLRSIGDPIPHGEALQCLVPGKICVGMAMPTSSPHLLQSYFGDLRAVYCNVAPGPKLPDPTDLTRVVSGGCPAGGYLLTFSDGAHATDVWVQDGKVARLDRGRAHDIDP